MNSNDVRNAFLNYFKKQGHTFIKSSPVVPLDDPTLLFTNAGMNQFKNIFLEKSTAESKRVANYQKCIRASGKHNDIEDVGRDNFHHTFFEMLGNWSFGDYYKEEAIFWAWELLTKEWNLPKDKLYPTIHHSDDESLSLWQKIAGYSQERIQKFGDKQNFWEMGDTGPCGPCTEIHMDMGEDSCTACEKNGRKCGVNIDGCSRFIELWNLVFIQYNRSEDKSITQLKKQHVDTGMGFERIARVLLGKSSNYDIDIFQNIIQSIQDITGKEYKNDNMVAMRVIADHIRALTFAITDGAIISNDGRNSVLRSILRRAARFGKTVLGQNEPFIYKVTDSVVDTMGNAYPEIKERKDYVKEIILDEEIAFSKTIDKGIDYFDKICSKLNKENKKEISGKDVFILHTQEGFPMDLTRQMAEEKGFIVDEKGFYDCMEQHRLDSKEGDKFKAYNANIDWKEMEKGLKSEFVGYDKTEIETHILKYGWDGSYIHIVSEKTPFYANMGGQVGDTGQIKIDDTLFNVIDTLKVGDDIVHIVDTQKEINIKNNSIRLSVDTLRRSNIAKNHTATHLLHSALRKVLGDNVTQQGSLVEPERLRFDFSHKEKLEKEQIELIEQLVNDEIRKGTNVQTSVMKFSDAKQEGAMALFGEKYGNEVRVVKIGEFSKELCGGTHSESIGEIGYFRILSESSIAAGIRRIEAVTGEKAFELIDEEKKTINSIKNILNTNSNSELEKKIDLLIQRVKELEKENKKLKTGNINIDYITSKSIQIDGISLIKSKLNDLETEELRVIGDKIKNKMKSCVIVLASAIENKINYICMVTEDIIKDKKLKAGDIIREVSKIADGGGGGKPDQATAGAKDISKLDESLSAVETIITNLLKK